jgi:hypothetical protein
LLRALKADSRLQTIPVLVLSTDTSASRMETEMHFKLSHPSVERVEDGAEAGHGGVCQQLETDSGVLTLCLQTQ